MRTNMRLGSRSRMNKWPVSGSSRPNSTAIGTTPSVPGKVDEVILSRVLRLRVEAGVRQGRHQLHPAQGVLQQRDEAVGIDRRPTPRDGAEDQVADAIDGGLQLAVAAVTDPLGVLAVPRPAADVV